MSIYDPTPDGVKALQMMSKAIDGAVTAINDATTTVKAVANENQNALGPHKSSLDAALDEIAKEVKNTTAPAKAVSDRLGKVAKGYQRLINNDRFKNLKK